MEPSPPTSKLLVCLTVILTDWANVVDFLTAGAALKSKRSGKNKNKNKSKTVSELRDEEPKRDASDTVEDHAGEESATTTAATVGLSGRLLQRPDGEAHMTTCRMGTVLPMV
jgi:hypothetical protein